MFQALCLMPSRACCFNSAQNSFLKLKFLPSICYFCFYRRIQTSQLSLTNHKNKGKQKNNNKISTLKHIRNKSINKTTNVPMASSRQAVPAINSSPLGSSVEEVKVNGFGNRILADDVDIKRNLTEFLQDCKTYSKYREWELTESSAALAEDNEAAAEHGVPFTIVSYNILAQDLLDEHFYLYRNHSYNCLDWEFRLDRLIDEILVLNPDVLCLQEVQYNHLDVILTGLTSLNFGCIYKRKTGSRTDGVAILYNRSLFDLKERHSVEYYQPGVEILNRDNVGLIAKLCLKSDSSACFIVATTHLLYNPRRQDVRLAQLQVLLAELDRTSTIGHYQSGKPRRIPIILNGDFNLKPYTAPYELVATGSLEYANLTRLLLETPFDDSFRKTGNRFLPPRLGITDQCQHLQGISKLQNVEQNRTVQYNSSLFDQYEAENEELLRNYPNLMGTGRLTHDLNLSSAYKHIHANGQIEGSTYQNKWITVDYFFYSKYFSPDKESAKDGFLNLLARYNLPSVSQCYEMGMVPNAQYGSDHLSLAAKFYLQVPKKS